MGKYILDKLEKMDDKIDDIRAQGVETKAKLESHDRRTAETSRHLDAVGKKLGEYNDQLTIHIQASTSNSKRINTLEEVVKPIAIKHNTEKAVNAYISEKWALRIKKATYVSIIIGIAVSLLKAYGMI